jgi:hypothetical protein
MSAVRDYASRDVILAIALSNEDIFTTRSLKNANSLAPDLFRATSGQHSSHYAIFHTPHFPEQ